VRFVFGSFEVDDELYELRKDGAPVALRPQAFDVLLCLLRAGGKVVTKAELIRAVWGGAQVSDTALPQAITAIRRALEDDAEEPTMLQTVRARGYRFAPTVQRPSPSPTPAAAPPLVGRDALVSQMRTSLDDATMGHGRTLLVPGAPGAGKTRILAEVGALARARGAVVLSARCEEEGAPDLWPWVQILRALAAHDDARGPAISAILPAAGGDVAEDERRFRAFDTTIQTLRGAAAARPVVILIDDLEWADASSLLLFKLAAQSFADARVLLVATYRDASLATSPVLARATGALTREDASRLLRLDPLAKEDVATLGRAVLGREPEPALVERVHAKSAGNALFVTQLLHVIRSERWLGPLEEGATSAMLAVDEVREAVGLHLGELSPECHRVLSAASVLGQELHIAALAPIVGLEPALVLPVLDEALRARIVAKSATPASYRFVHALVRDVLYKNLDGADRARLHEAAARALSALGQDQAAAEHRARLARLVGA
jgi:predicted ATPase